MRPVSSQHSSKSAVASSVARSVKKSVSQDQPANLHPITAVEKAPGRSHLN